MGREPGASRGHKYKMATAAVALTFEAVQACSGGKPAMSVTSASASESQSPFVATSGSRPRGEATPTVSAITGTLGPKTDRPPFQLPAVPGETINVANCPVLARTAQVEAPADPGPQVVKLTATAKNPGFTLEKGTDATFISNDRRERVMIEGEGQTLDVNVNGTETQQPLNGEPVVVRQNISGDNLLENGSGAPVTACGREPNALPTFLDVAANTYRGPVTIVTINEHGVTVNQGSI